MRHHIGLAALAAGMALALVPAAVAGSTQPGKKGDAKPACPKASGNGQGGTKQQRGQAPQGKACGQQGHPSQQGQPSQQGGNDRQGPPPTGQGKGQQGKGLGQGEDGQQQGPPPLGMQPSSR